MKKQILAGTAFVAAAMLVAGGAMAQDKMKKKMMKPSISVGGYAEFIVGAPMNVDETGVTEKDTPALDQRIDSEVWFKGAATLDNGVKIAARWELEGTSNDGKGPDVGDTIDETWLAISGSFGKIVLGATENAPTMMLTKNTGSWATRVGRLHTFYSHEWVRNLAQKNFGTIVHPRLSSGDQEKITYLTPAYSGLQVGMSYVPAAKEDNHTNHDIDENGHDGLAAALGYNGKFGDVGIGGGFGYMSMQGAGDGPDSSGWNVVGRLDFGGFRVAGAYKRTEEPNASAGFVFDGGVRYVVGANQYSLVGSYGEMDDTGDNYRAATASYARALGPGTKLHVNLITNRSEVGATELSGLAGSVGVLVLF